MIPETKAIKLIEIYFYIDKRYNEVLKYCCQRFSNNNKQELTGQEIMTIYLFSIHCLPFNRKLRFVNYLYDSLISTLDDGVNHIIESSIAGSIQ